ncbi:hypothetical protein SAMN05421751_1355 [Jhaorihella thermophila]|uniref:DUF3789 domain-containing protein n=1 Tax=Jhaorihella thermophila TaxID=488547 RepID=A0A1H5ZEC6_9RHOB|nr:hypothetical protein SAMN05421751_1355 [Jhaorihella thermophila]
MFEFLAGFILGGCIGVFIVALCVAAGRGERNDG